LIEAYDLDLVTSRVDWARLRGKRILITGGTGFVGRWMSTVPDDVTVFPLNHLQYDYGNWDRADWDYIIHLANVDPARVIACAKNCGATILYSSSGAVVSDVVDVPYTINKRRDEEMLLSSGLDVKIARLFTFAGGYMPNRFAVTNMIYDGLQNNDIRIRAYNVTTTRTYMYAADMAVWIWRILLDGKRRGIYEVGATHPVNMQQLAEEVRRNFSPRMIEHWPAFGPDPRPYYVPRQADETARELGVEIYTPFAETIRRTVEFYKREMEVWK
jgi:nucleoside-diphosphate-sugar epimerase